MYLRVIVLLFIGIVLSGCSESLVEAASVNSPVIKGPAPRFSMTPMSHALACLRSLPKNDLRIGVSEITDGTGVMEGGAQNSRALSQRPDMMMVVALSNAGASLVNRSSVNVAEWEMGKAMEKKLGDGRAAMMDLEKVYFRPIKSGVLLGSTHYITGAITELNWNIDSGVAEGGAYSASLGRRTYRISIAVDIVVTDTVTTRIVHARSYTKQVVGIEQNANFFRFFAQSAILKAVAAGNPPAAALTQAMELFNANIGEKQNEPTQTALRWVIDLAAYDIMRTLNGSGEHCDAELPDGTRDAVSFDQASPGPQSHVLPFPQSQAQATPRPQPRERPLARTSPSAPLPVLRPALSDVPPPEPLTLRPSYDEN